MYLNGWIGLGEGPWETRLHLAGDRNPSPHNKNLKSFATSRWPAERRLRNDTGNRFCPTRERVLPAWCQSV